jgi:hypothetical protein
MGPKVLIPASPVQIFNFFFTIEILEYIVQQTNLYASECMGAVAFESWQPLSVPELQAYMGFMILMGLVKLPALFDYWKNDPTFHYSHFVDNSTLAPTGSPMYNKLGKIEPIINRLTEQFELTYHPLVTTTAGNDVVDHQLQPYQRNNLALPTFLLELKKDVAVITVTILDMSGMRVTGIALTVRSTSAMMGG